MSEYDDWAAAQDSATVTVDGHEVDVAFTDEGEGDPVVFLHGIPTNSFLFRDHVPAIAEGRRAIAPDMVGYGNSAMHDGFDRSIRAQEQMLEGLLDELDIETVDFVGHDLGGGVGLRFAAHNPDRVGKLVLSNSVAYDSWPIQTITDVGLPETARDNSVDDVQEMMDGLFRDTLYGDADEVFVEGMKAPWNSEEGVVSLCRDAVATNTNHTTEIDPSDVTADTLLLWGTEDEFQPVEYAERLESDIDSCELVGLDEARHWVPEDRTEAFRDHLKSFLLDD